MRSSFLGLRHPGRSWLPLLALSLGAGVFVGCDKTTPVSGDRVTNTPPNTEIVSAPPSTERTGIRTTFAWTGVDPDGDVIGFEWRISDNGNDGIVSVEDTLTANLPWNFTTARDTTFLVTADLDSFDVDVDDPTLGPRDYRYWQSHTLFVRAVDEEGGVDPTPAHVSFTSTTLAPTIEIDVPKYRSFNTCVDASRVLTFGWTGADIDSDDGQPEAVRTILLPIGLQTDPCITQVQFEAGDFLPYDDPRWSDWIPYDAPNFDGRRVVLPRQATGSSFLFAVQAMDDAGAVTPTLEWGRNVRHVRVGNNKFPLLQVQESLLGSFSAVGTASVKSFDVVATQPIEFRWSGDGSSYAGTVDAYRYGVNVSDTQDPFDAGWVVPWGNGAEWVTTGPLLFEDGSPNVVIQCRDNSGTISQVLIQLRVVGLANRQDQRDLLIVDDWPEGPTTLEQIIDRSWDAEWFAIGQNLLSDFLPQDLVDAQSDSRLGFDLVNQYKSVIWFTNSNINSYMRQEILGSGNFNWLELYQQRVGNILVAGPGGGVAISPSRAWVFPLVFDVGSSGFLGLGTTVDANGNLINAGTLTYPYRSFCLEAVDWVRPALLKIFGEAGGVGGRRRMGECDSIIRAHPADVFFDDYPDAVGSVVELKPRLERQNLSNDYRFDFEEFYNANVTPRRVTINLRPCQTTMFTMVARRDEGYVENPQTACEPRNRTISVLDGVPVGVVSRANSETKQLRGSEDAIWGFHPLAFGDGGIRSALTWLAGSRWELNVR